MVKAPLLHGKSAAIATYCVSTCYTGIFPTVSLLVSCALKRKAASRDGRLPFFPSQEGASHRLQAEKPDIRTYFPWCSSLTVSFLRPCARREAKTRRPFFVAIRARKPCLFTRRRLWGWNVLFIVDVCYFCYWSATMLIQDCLPFTQFRVQNYSFLLK